ncbi:hypothetical protein AXG93_4620s1470 [Marchantia polymorpha subsp. ruderalis]|uniref:Uncharacterized protein n=1 Tax=Marchantia polymorpha subsp. ruderalis TaxID=1480154 RepID=A0A176VY69_MARPO|nr:hypothetical protein AXG93_4620s1470 [Marchantia polymorpha subsp. ruderalis]
MGSRHGGREIISGKRPRLPCVREKKKGRRELFHDVLPSDSARQGDQGHPGGVKYAYAEFYLASNALCQSRNFELRASATGLRSNGPTIACAAEALTKPRGPPGSLACWLAEWQQHGWLTGWAGRTDKEVQYPQLTKYSSLHVNLVSLVGPKDTLQWQQYGYSYVRKGLELIIAEVDSSGAYQQREATCWDRWEGGSCHAEILDCSLLLKPSKKRTT